MRWLLALFFCVTGVRAASDDERRDLERAESLLAQGQEQDAFVSLSDFLRRYPYSRLGPTAQLRMGDLHLRRSEFEQAQSSYKRVHSLKSAQMEHRLRAALGSGDALKGLGKADLALIEWQAVRRKAVKHPELAEAARIRILGVDPHAKVTDPVSVEASKP